MSQDHKCTPLLVASTDSEAPPQGGHWRLLAERYDIGGHAWPDKYSPSQRDATITDFTTWLIANPEARMAVLEKMPEMAELREVCMVVCNQYGFGACDASPPHERNAISILSGILLRDSQALPAPTAESGKDSASPPPSDAERCKRTVHSFKGMVRCLLAEGHGGFHSYDEPAPVAEAEGRVTHSQAGVALQAIAERPASEKTQERLELLELYRQLQEQSEREAVEICKVMRERGLHTDAMTTPAQAIRRELRRLDHEIVAKIEGVKAERLEHEREAVELREEFGACERLLAQANVEIGTRDTDIVNLRAKLSEAERKLEQATQTVADIFGALHNPFIDDEKRLRKLDALLPLGAVSFDGTPYIAGRKREPAAQEPTGGEPAKPETAETLPRCRATRKNPAGSVVQCVHPRNHLGVHSALGGEWPNQAEDWDFGNPDLNPTSPASEAPPKFRVGQLLSWLPSGRRFRVTEQNVGDVNRVPENYRLIDEPADPAPPKPGDGVTRAELLRVLRAASFCSSDGGFNVAVRELGREGGDNGT